MVFLMDITAEGKGDTVRALDAPQAEETTRSDRFTMLENLPPSISNSRIYRKEDFICSKLSNGFYGDIFKVQHRETGEVMVLKMNKPDVELENCSMLDEIKLMSHLSHPNVLKFIGVCISDSKVHLLCEFINGGELEELLLDYSIHLDWSTRLYLAQDIAEGMRYLHKQGVIHRDLTSKNCLIKEMNGWRYGIVADLGLATEIKEQSIVGSPFNMAPELLRGEAYDEKADVFSYGIILCEIIGRVPADPDELPRTKKFGLDVEKFQHMTGDCPNEFLQTALCCCQMEPSTRPTFAETSKHLEFILVGYKGRPAIDEAMNAPSPEPQIPHSPPPAEENEQENSSDKSDAVMTTYSPALPTPPAVIVSAETSPPLNIRSAEKRRQSWIAGRYKMFNVATDDLLKNTPGKLKCFFHRALRINTHFDPVKQKKFKDGGKQRSASQLKRYDVIGSDENGRQRAPAENCEQLMSGSSETSSHSPNTLSRRFLRKKNSEQDLMYNFSLEGDSVDGRYSPRSVHSDSSITLPSNSHGHLLSPNELGVPQSYPWPHSLGVDSSPVSKDLKKPNRPRCQATPLASGLNLQKRRTSSDGECESNIAYSTSQAHTEPEGKHKNQKSPFWIFKRRGSKFKESE